jgi:hypothetical protein
MIDEPAHRYRLSRMSPADLREYAEAFLRELQRAFEESGSTKPHPRFPHVRRVELHGEYPDAHLIIRYFDPERAENRKVQFRAIEPFEVYDPPDFSEPLMDQLNWPDDEARMIVNNWQASEFFSSSRPDTADPDTEEDPPHLKAAAPGGSRP